MPTLHPGGPALTPNIIVSRAEYGATTVPLGPSWGLDNQTGTWGLDNQQMDCDQTEELVPQQSALQNNVLHML